jgi:hypothetical protein
VKELPATSVARGWQAFGSEGQLIGRVDAVFADYLLVRTMSLLPVDLYVPMDALVGGSNGRVILRSRAHEAYERWHRPLKRAPHP